MFLLVAYDVNTEDADGRRRLRHVATICEQYGQRVQFSLFECSLTRNEFEQLRADLLDEIDKQEDSLRLYRIPGGRARNLEEHGAKEAVDLDGPLIV